MRERVGMVWVMCLFATCLVGACQDEAVEDSTPAASTESPAPAEPPEPPTLAEAMERIRALGGTCLPADPKPGETISRVDLSGTKVTDADMIILLAFPDVHLIELQDTKVTDAGIAQLTSLAKLVQIDLQRTGVTIDGVRTLMRGVLNLRSLDLTGTAITAEDLISVRGIPGASDIGIKAFRWRDIDQLAIGEWIPGEWVDSDDGALSLRLLKPSNDLLPSYPFMLAAEVRNNTDAPVSVLPPFRGRSGRPPFGITITGPDGVLECKRWVSDRIGMLPVETIAPGDVMHDQVELHTWQFIGSDKPDAYTIAFEYHVPEHLQEIVANPPYERPPLWIGEISAKPITITKSE